MRAAIAALLLMVGSMGQAPTPSESVAGRTATERGDAFSVLEHRTGWVILGALWGGTGELFNPEYDATNFAIVSRAVDVTVRPEVGDLVQSLRGWGVVILDYQISGETRRLEPPQVKQVLSSIDDTHLRISPGAVVRVEDLSVSRSRGPLRLLWVRVSDRTGRSTAPPQFLDERPDAFKTLEFKTGWVVLGIVWTERPNEIFNAERGGKSYEVVGRDVGVAEFPVVGDQIRATSDWGVTILDYKLLGEEHRLVSPTSRPMLSRADQTGLRILQGTLVQVREVALDPPTGESMVLWARVSPTAE